MKVFNYLLKDIDKKSFHKWKDFLKGAHDWWEPTWVINIIVVIFFLSYSKSASFSIGNIATKNTWNVGSQNWDVL